MTTKHQNRLVQVCLLWFAIGIFVSLLQAWGVVLFFISTSVSPIQQTSIYSAYKQRGSISSWQSVDTGVGERFVRYKTSVAGKVYEVVSTQIPQRIASDEQPIIPKWMIIQHGQPDDFVKIQAHGWPFTSWSGIYIYNLDKQTSSWSWCLPDERKNWAHAYLNGSLFPLRPVIPGVILNGVFYGVLVYSGTRSAKWLLLRFIRLRRLNAGKCPSCAYDTRGLTTCPECREELTSTAES